MWCELSGRKETKKNMQHEIAGMLRSELGFSAADPWLAACLQHLQAGVPSFSSKPPGERLRLVLEQLLHADLRAAGAGGVLPGGVASMHKRGLEGRFLLQVDEVANVAAPWRER